MTVADLRCDLCGRFLAGPAGDRAGGHGAIRLMIHPGDARLKDDTTLVCAACWGALEEEWAEPERADVCATCAAAAPSDDSLHVSRVVGGPGLWPTWQLCREHAVGFLNRLRNTDPKLTPQTLRLRRDFLTGAG